MSWGFRKTSKHLVRGACLKKVLALTILTSLHLWLQLIFITLNILKIRYCWNASLKRLKVAVLFTLTLLGNSVVPNIWYSTVTLLNKNSCSNLLSGVKDWRSNYLYNIYNIQIWQNISKHMFFLLLFSFSQYYWCYFFQIHIHRFLFILRPPLPQCTCAGPDCAPCEALCWLRFSASSAAPEMQNSHELKYENKKVLRIL